MTASTGYEKGVNRPFRIHTGVVILLIAWRGFGNLYEAATHPAHANRSVDQ